PRDGRIGPAGTRAEGQAMIDPPDMPTKRSTRVFNIWGTLVYSICSSTAFIFMIAMGFGILPPWYITLLCLFYVFLSSGFIALGRMDANMEAWFFNDTLRKLSEEDKKHANREMN